MTAAVLQARHRWRAEQLWPELLAGSLLLLSWGPVLHADVSHDIAWQLWLGRQMVHGAGLYSSLSEVNPPLWFWAGAGVVRLAELLGLAPASVLFGAFLAGTALSFALLARLIRELAPARRAWIYGVFGLVTVVYLLREYGQREQWTLLAALPYAALIARRAEQRAVSNRLAAGVALFAATGFALKPYFALAPLLLEGWLFLAARRAWRPWRPEWFVLGLGALSYAAAVALFAPAFFTVSLPMDRLAYGAYDLPFGEMLTTEFAPTAVFAAIGAMLLVPFRSRLTAALLTAGAAFAGGYFVQAKGWFYQSIPATGCLLMAIAAEAPSLRWSDQRLRGRLGAAAWGLAFLTPALIVASLGVNYANRYRNRTLAALSDLRPGQAVMAFSARSTIIWPMVEARGLVWPSRYYTFWMLPAVAADRASGRPSPALARLATTIQRQTLQDLSCRPPVRILLHDPQAEARDRKMFRNPGFDYLAFFREEPRLAALLAHYRPSVRGGWRVLDLVDPNGIRPVGPCRTIY
ncbi:MAG TPA: hypothetical protein VLI41_03630 [Phenylobacterium sp.]|uniref:hypothetical protein n=1 Tax=Phenylobacterium sp. TaxID=1871053 RepID=UPI002D10035C|nr:hypothetical protein [Phenylobacterium sp.]HSV02274.1 hypothetical protein [Phenylobacterium sp.]